MRKYIKQSYKKLEEKHYLAWVIFLAPMLNFLSGMSIDLYAPSLPAMADYFQTSMTTIKSTIAIAMVGFSLGCIIFGPIMDSFGRRITIMTNLLIFLCISMIAMFSQTIETMMTIRFLQGLMIGTFSIASRALVMDYFEGKRFVVAVVYLSIAYGLGPIIGPFLGGLLQISFGWQANFFAFALIAASLLCLFFFVVPESLKIPQHFSFPTILKNYRAVLTNKKFMTGTLILGGASMIQMIFPTLGPFVVEKTLQKSPVVFGNIALLIGCSYLCGTLCNKVLLHHYHQEKLIQLGFIGLIISCLMQWFFCYSIGLTLTTLALSIFLICGSIGLIFSNILSLCLRDFPQTVGIASAVQMCLLVGISAFGVFIISHFNVTSLVGFAVAYSSAITFQTVIYFCFFKRAIKSADLSLPPEKM